jgi:hypothetical protein
MQTTPVHLWRGVRVEDFPDGVVNDDQPADGIMHPDFVRKQTGTTKDGTKKFRKADVRTVDGLVQIGGGTSLFDKDKFFKGRSWGFFYIPKGTELDPILKLSGPDWREFFEANHYQVEVVFPVTQEAYKGALDNLARKAVAKAYEDARR